MYYVGNAFVGEESFNHFGLIPRPLGRTSRFFDISSACGGELYSLPLFLFDVLNLAFFVEALLSVE